MAKSPTPIPAPPVKIQRDTNGAATGRPGSKAEKCGTTKAPQAPPQSLLWFLHGLIRRHLLSA